MQANIATLKNSHRTLEEDLDGLIREADQALYLAKNNGGDTDVSRCVIGGGAEEGAARRLPGRRR